MRRQGQQSTREKPPDKERPGKQKQKKVVFCTTVDPIITKEGKITSIYADSFPPNQEEKTNTSASCLYMIDGVQTNIYPMISFSGMYQK